VNQYNTLKDLVYTGEMMSSKNKKILRAGPKRTFSRIQAFPKKVFKEIVTWDIQTAIARKQIEEAFPDPGERLNYLNSLIEAMGPEE
jgi:hypothetical protein